MAKSTEALYAFNRGIIDPLAVARVDVKRHALSAEEQTNFLPRVLGPMSLRPGLEHLGTTYAPAPGAKPTPQFIPFVFSTSDTALLEFSSNRIRIWIDDALVAVPEVTTALTNGAFSGSIAGWTVNDDASSLSNWLTDAFGVGFLQQYSQNGFATARVYQQAVVAANSQNVEHFLTVIVAKGAPHIRVGSTLHGEEYVGERELLPGYHVISFTPTGNFYVEFTNTSLYTSLVRSCIVNTLTGPLDALVSDIAPTSTINYEQSGDVVYLASEAGDKIGQVERHGTHSWSFVRHRATTGPFNVENLSDVTLTPSALVGDITLTASKAVFKEDHAASYPYGLYDREGALFAITSVDGQHTPFTGASAANIFTSSIRVTGVSVARNIRVTAHFGLGVGKITLQRSYDLGTTWVDVESYGNGGDKNGYDYNDTFDNLAVLYRIGVKVGEWTSGTLWFSISVTTGRSRGIVQVTEYVSGTQVKAQVLAPLGGLTASPYWEEGEWSPYRGYPSAVGIHEGRLWWAGKDGIWGSASDAYYTHDVDVEGDSGPISRRIGRGPVDTINWLLSTDSLVMGGQGAEHTVRSSALGDPITPTDFGIKSSTTRGSAAVRPALVDARVLFVDRSKAKLIELEPDAYGRFSAREVTLTTPEVCKPSVVRLAAQRLPDTRVHAVLSDGTVALLVYDKAEEVNSWVKVTTDGLIKDVAVLPNTDGTDRVYYVVDRAPETLGAGFSLEKWADESDCVGGSLNKQADSFVSYTGVATATVTGLSHLEGREVVCWADGVDQGTFTVASGAITLPVAVTNAVAGLTYRARFKSVPLGYAVQGGHSLTAKKRTRVDHVSFMLANTHAQGLAYGTDFDYLDDLPLYEEGAEVVEGTVHAVYDGDPVEVNGTLNNRTQLCLEANAPRPCTVLAAVISISED